MVKSSNSRLQKKAETGAGNSANRFFVIRRVGTSRAGRKKRTTTWPMTTAQRLRRQNRLLAALGCAANLLTGEVDGEDDILQVLTKLGGAADVSRLYMFENSRRHDNDIRMSLRYEWVAGGIQGRCNGLQFQNLPYETSGFGRWMPFLSRKKTIAAQITGRWPAGHESRSLGDIKSIALAPIFVNNCWWGFLGGDECRSDWRSFDEISDVLKIAAEILGAAIERIRPENGCYRNKMDPGTGEMRPLLTATASDRFGDIIGRSKPMQAVYGFILQAAASEAGVILYGESGTGKELVAKAIHNASKQRGRRFVAVNCGAIPEPILESEFFGYKNGAFTGAVRDKKGILDLADGGTLFLDEVGELTVQMQVKLLRAIEGRGYTPLGGQDLKKPNFRIIAATNKDLLELVKASRLREDFYFRIHVLHLRLPALRDRKEDLPLLISHFLKKFSRNGNKAAISAAALQTLTGHDWPGNVRELQNVLHRYVAVGQLELSQPFDAGSPPDDSRHQLERNLALAVERFERRFIRQVLDDARWHKGRAAAVLGICRKTLQRKIKRHGLDKNVK